MVQLHLLGFLVLLFGVAVPAQDPKPVTPEPAEAQGQEPEVDTTMTAVRALRESIATAKTAVETADAAVAAATTEADRVELQAIAAQRRDELQRLRHDLEELVTGVDLDAYDSTPGGTFDLAEEVVSLMRPLVEEVKSATQSPRQITHLRGEVEYYEERRRLAQRALENILRLSGQATPEERERLEGFKEEWERRRSEAVNRLTVIEHRLNEKLSQQSSLLESTSTFFDRFFRERGTNLILALAAFALVFIGGRAVARVAMRLISRRRKEGSFYRRLVSVLAQVAVVVVAVLAAVTVLYVMGDWVLLGIFMLLLFWAIVASKELLPRVVEEARIVLGLGALRENERVVFAGVPWRIDTLNFYTVLSNPDLSGGRIRLPVRQLFGLHSRPCGPKEAWFPCREGDWVELGDGTRGKVLSQTPELVQLVKLGGSRVTYPTEAFLGSSPENLSGDFRLKGTFGIDYQHQAICTTEVPEIMQAALVARLGDKIGAENIRNLTVDFQSAGASSLDYAVIADLSGDVAARKEALGRLIQRELVNACNEHGWVIPFTQITVHQA